MSIFICRVQIGEVKMRCVTRGLFLFLRGKIPVILDRRQSLWQQQPELKQKRRRYIIVLFYLS